VKLINASITNYISVEDSGRFAIEPDVTCVVRRNKSGQAAPLWVLVRLSPVEKFAVFEEITGSPTHTTRGRKRRAGREQVPIVVAPASSSRKSTWSRSGSKPQSSAVLSSP
jgi:hypothetical protein